MNMDMLPPKPKPIELFTAFVETWGPRSEHDYIGISEIRQELYAVIDAFRMEAMQPFIDAAGHAFAMKPTPPMIVNAPFAVQFEYRIESPDNFQYADWLDGIGAEGWRLDGIHHDDGAHVFSRIKQAGGPHAQQAKQK